MISPFCLHPSSGLFSAISPTPASLMSWRFGFPGGCLSGTDMGRERWWLHHIVNARNVTELSLKWLIFCYVNFTSIKNKTWAALGVRREAGSLKAMRIEAPCREWPWVTMGRPVWVSLPPLPTSRTRWELGLGRKAQLGQRWGLGRREALSERRRLQPPLICIISDWFSLLVPY